MNREIARMTWKEFEEAKRTKTLIIPVGSLEQHGYHLPMETDVIISSGLAKVLAEKIDGIVAPPVNYGYKSQPNSGGGPLFPGTVDLNGDTLVRLVYDMLCEFARDGVKKIFISNGHFENEAFLVEAVDLATRQYDIHVVLASWWDQIPSDMVEKCFEEVPFPGWALEHAAVTETSMVMYFTPELVHMDRFVEEEFRKPGLYHDYPIKPGIVPASGVLATARTSSRGKGALLVESITDAYAGICREAFKSYDDTL